jgi:Ca-activated chloride channel family protein
MKRQLCNLRKITFAAALILAAGLIIVPSNALAQQKGNAFAPVRSRGANGGESITINTELVSLQVSVTDKHGRFVSGLNRSSITVYEDGVRQEINFFSDQDTPIAVGIVLDVSGSMTDEKIKRAREALARFIQTSHEEDEYFLIGFNEHPQLLLNGVRGSETVLARISGIKPQGNTALYDAVAFSLGQVAHSRLPKHALIVISDGEDNRSRLDFGQVRRLLREADVTVYTILIGPLLPHSNGGVAMDDLASASGGKSYFPSNAEKMSEVFERIALELRHQYSIGYAPSNFVADGRWRRIKVSVTPPCESRSLIVRSRAGYYAVTNRAGREKLALGDADR